MLYRSVWLLSAISAALLVALHVADQLTPNDFALGLLLKRVEYFALGLGILGSLLFLCLLFFPDVAKSKKLRAFLAVTLPYLVLVILWLIANASRVPQK